MNNKLSRPVPVLMYHSVGIPNKKWNWNYLTCPYELFEDQLKTLNRNGFKSISLNQLYDYIFFSKPIPVKPIVFTFDDGYLDNWVFAYPMMKKYGSHGTIFVNPDFVDENGGIRKHFDETKNIDSLVTSGFLSWDEMREMEKEGVMSIESHALTHTWYPKSNKIIDFRHPGDKYIWMTWNDNVNLKYKLQTDHEDLVQLGEPVYEYEKSLSDKRFFPDEKLKEYLCSFVINKGSKSFFNNANWRDQLKSEVEIYKSSHLMNESYETDEDFHLRILSELQLTKSIIESKLCKKVWFHCWPGGSATKTGMEISNSLGFRLSNAANDILSIRYKIKNNNQLQINRINRFAPIAFFNDKENNESYIRYSNGILLMLQINVFTKKGFEKLFFRLLLLISMILLEIKYKIKL